MFLAFMLEHYFSNDCNKFTFLDVASNSGEISRELAKFELHNRIVGVDIDPDSVKWANQLVQEQNLDNIQYFCCDAVEIPMMDATFDYINFGVSLGFFIDSKREALAEACRLLKSNGVIFVSNLYYKRTPTKELIKKVEQVLGLKISDSQVMDYDYHNAYLSDYFQLDCEVNLNFSGENTYQDYFLYIKDFCKNNPNSIEHLSQKERDNYFHLFASQRKILNENDLHCDGVLQAWMKK